MSIRVRAGFAIFCAGMFFLLASLHSKVSYDRFRKQFSRYESAITCMDIMESAIPKLKSAEKALTLYSENHGDSTDPHGPNPRESAQHVKRARKVLERGLDDRQLRKSHQQLADLFSELKEADTVRTEYYYSPLRERIEKIRGGLQSELSRVAAKLPRELVTTRKRFRKEISITFYVGLGVSAFGLLMVWGWYSDFKERRALKKSLEWDVYDEPESPRESGHGTP